MDLNGISAIVTGGASGLGEATVRLLTERGARCVIVDMNPEKGEAVAVDGKRLSPATLLHTLNRVAGAHGIGRIDIVENRYVGMKSRGVYETPGGTVLRAAINAVEQLTMDREVMHLRDSLVPRYAEMVYNGYWFAPERHMLQHAMDEAARVVTGTARLKLYRGSVRVTGRKAPKSLYDARIASFDEAGGYSHEDATGFIRLNGLRLRIQALVERGGK
ncbi:MAG: SDR family NAD(P)-dependent oxidoreductase [Acidimicrobiales bacterium]